MPRAERRHRTARLLAEAATADAEERDSLLNQVIEVNIGVAHAIAHRYRDRAVAVEDLEQVACMALVRAAHKFDVSQEHDFLTYAVPTISGEIKRYFRDHGWTIRPPRRIQEIQSRVIHAYRAGHRGDAPPSTTNLAEELGLPEPDVIEALAAQACFVPDSLDLPLEGAGRTLADQLRADTDAESAALEARLLLGPALRRLTVRERQILEMRFVQEMTQQEIGDALGVTQMHASRVLKRILVKLRSELGETAASA